MKPFDIKKFLTENKLTKLTNEVELPAAVVSKANVAIGRPADMAKVLLDFIDQIDDKENPSLFKNAKLDKAIEFLKNLADDEAQPPASTNEKAFVRIAKGPNDVIDPADYIDIAHGYLKGFNKPYNIGDDDLKNVGRKIVNNLYNGDIDKAKNIARKLKDDKFYKLCMDTTQKRFEKYYSEEMFVKNWKRIWS